MAEFEELIIEPRGSEYVLSRDDGEGNQSELILSEGNVVMLGRLAPTIARRIVASKGRSAAGVEASVAAPVKDFRLALDLHNDLVLLRLHDELDAEFDFSFSASDARLVGERLIAWADKAVAAPKPSKQ